MSDSDKYDGDKSNSDATDASVHNTQSPLKLKKYHGSPSENSETFCYGEYLMRFWPQSHAPPQRVTKLVSVMFNVHSITS
jgi:hypothetical protein